MNDAWHLAKIKGFEQVLAAPGIALLRVAAKPPRKARAGRRPILLADDGHTVNRYDPLPSPQDPKGILRAAYSVPADFVTPETVFSLQLDDGTVLSLPAPTEGAARPVGSERPDADEAAELFAESPAADPADDAEAEPLAALDPVADLGEARDTGSDAETAAVLDEKDEDDEPDASAWAGGPPPWGERRSDVMARVVELSAAIAVAEREIRQQRDARKAAEASARESAAARDAALAQLEALQAEGAQHAQAAQEESDGRSAAARAELERELAETRAELEAIHILEEQARAELAAARDDEQQVRSELAEVAGRVRGEVEAELAQARAELEAQIEQVGTREQAAVEREQAAAEREREAAAEAARARDSVAGYERRVAGLELSLTEHGDQIAGLEAKLAESTRLREHLEREVVSLRTECARLERELHDALDSTRKMALERDELGRQAAAFDQVAIKARERATHAEEAHQRSQAVLDELETWRGELERRLASMSTELGEAKRRLSDSDRELKRVRGELAEAEARAELAQAQILAFNERAGGGAGGATTVIDSAELERMTGELASLRAESARAGQELDDATWMRIREAETQRDDLARRVAELETAQRAAQLAEEQRASAEQAPSPDPAPAPAAAAPNNGAAAPGAGAVAAGPDLADRSPEERAAIAALTEQAEADADALAARELAEALARRK